MRRPRVWLACGGLTLSLLLGACTPPPKPQTVPALSWQQRQARLQLLNKWTFSGRLAVSVKDEGWQASLDWRQDHRHYLLRILAPLGMGGVELRGDVNGVILTFDGDQPPLHAERAENLLQAMYGWSIPVDQLRYWLVGVPAPGTQASVQLDMANRLLEMKVGPWQVSYQRYGHYSGYELPEKLTIKRPGYRLRLVISEWQI
ncbi:MAG TPA: outer membrane lipoprotein LolB [Gammaproteobacteria bacterium]|nr:outer membrane lipoprotein LolB [Gammaproteobacteria bacterium]